LGRLFALRAQAGRLRRLSGAWFLGGDRYDRWVEAVLLEQVLYQVQLDNEI